MSALPRTKGQDAAVDLIGVIGVGRAGGALAVGLAAAGFPVGPLWSRERRRAEERAAAIAGAYAVESPQAVADGARFVVIATPDRSIADVAEAIRWRPGTDAVHISGGTPVTALVAAARAGCLTGGWHPLKSFAGVAGDVDFAGITFAVEAEGGLRRRLVGMTAALGGRALALEAADRTRYHASAALASNALVALLAEAAGLWQGLGCSRGEALAALLPLVEGTIANLRAVGLPAALTGPVERGDANTVAAHLAALEGIDAGAAAIYRVLSRAALDLAVEKGGLTDPDVIALRLLLADERVRVAV